MSEITNTCESPANFRWRLLTTVSAIALLGFVYETSQAQAADNNSDRPTFWIELGGQFAQQENDQEAFLPPFLLTTPRPPFDAASPAEVEKGPPSSWDGMAKITFEPAGTDWVFSVGVLYGKNSRNETRNQLATYPTANYHANYDAYQNIAARNSESRTILDFQAGKDVGLGRFGNSVVSLGVRFAQFNSQTDTSIHSQPTNVVYAYHKFYGSFAAKRKFVGIGPLLSWDASAGLISNPSGGAISLDWGVNGALLFGRQRMKGHHQTTNIYLPRNEFYGGTKTVVYQHHPVSPDRSKQVVVPNLGGFAGVSWRLPNAKVSVGYRADFFFGAMDGGIDAAHRENVGFYGPFASVSVGIGG